MADINRITWEDLMKNIEEDNILTEIALTKECIESLERLQKEFERFCDKYNFGYRNINEHYQALKKSKQRLECLRIDLCRVRGE